MLKVEEKAIEALQEAVEGECDGLVIDHKQAKAILAYVFLFLAHEVDQLRRTRDDLHKANNRYLHEARDARSKNAELEREVERLREAAGNAYRACMSAWACGEPPHRVKTMIEEVERLGVVIGEAGAAALSSAAVAEREPVAVVVGHHAESGNRIEWLRDLAPVGSKLYLDPPSTSELEAENARLRDQSENRKDAITTLRRQVSEYAEWWAQEQIRANAAEARLAEALKALDDMDSRYRSGANADTLVLIARKAARRVREGGKVDG